jgi:hypothetical protein
MIKTSLALADLGDILTPADVQRFLGIGRNATYELLASGKLTSVRITPRRLVVTKKATDMTMNDLFDRFMQAKEGRLASRGCSRLDMGVGLLRESDDRKHQAESKRDD